VVIAYQGAVAPEAIAAAGMIGDGRRDIGVLAVTSADRLNAGWTAAQRARARGRTRGAVSHVERLLEPLPPHCHLVTVIDGHPATLAWLGSCGHRTIPLGVEHFGQTGRLADLYRHFGRLMIALRSSRTLPGQEWASRAA
jgi:pyruvate dehydrogenase E1 component